MKNESKQGKRVLFENFIEYQKRIGRNIKIMSEITTYLKQNNIYFKTAQTEKAPRITMVFENCDRCPDGIVEGCIWFFKDSMEVRIYYSKTGAEICKKSKNFLEIYRLINFINARLWIGVSYGAADAIDQSKYLISPRFYVTEDKMKDITATMLIPYTYFEQDMLAMEDFITAALPDLLDDLSEAVFLLLTGRITADKAIDIVKEEVLRKAQNG